MVDVPADFLMHSGFATVHVLSVVKTGRLAFYSTRTSDFSAKRRDVYGSMFRWLYCRVGKPSSECSWRRVYRRYWHLFNIRPNGPLAWRLPLYMSCLRFYAHIYSTINQRAMDHYLSDLHVSSCDDKQSLPDLVNERNNLT